MKYTYKQAFDKITEAYIKGEIIPMSPTFCFCGTLALDYRWAVIEDHKVKEYPYTYKEYSRMEYPLLTALGASGSTQTGWIISSDVDKQPEYENNLFKGMCKALDVLKSIHIERGEQIEETTFIKREKQLA